MPLPQVTELLVLACLFGTVGCAEESVPERTEADSVLPDAPADNTQLVAGPPSKDQSLTEEEYAALGMPTHDRLWSDAEMAKAASVLQTLGQNAPEHLPRFNSKRSGKVFARLAARENLEAYKSEHFRWMRDCGRLSFTHKRRIRCSKSI